MTIGDHIDVRTPRMREARRPTPGTFEIAWRDVVYELLYVAPHPLPIGICACRRGESAGAVTAAIAKCAATELDRPVLVIEANLRHPTLSNIFHIPAAPGLSALLSSSLEAVTSDAIQATGYQHISVLPAGAKKQAWDHDGFAQQVQKLVASLARPKRRIIVDLPAPSDAPAFVYPSFDCAAVVIAVRPRVTGIRELQHTVRQLARAQVDVIGTIIDEAHTGGHGQSHRFSANIHGP